MKSIVLKNISDLLEMLTLQLFVFMSKKQALIAFPVGRHSRKAMDSRSIRTELPFNS